MPTLETPPNPAPHSPLPDDVQPLKVRAGRFGELDHSELVHLLDSLDDDRSRSRFRESIYLSVIFYLAVAWFVFYGPKVLFHQGRLVSPADVLKQRDKELTFLEVPKNLEKVPPPKDAKAISERNARQQTAHPVLDKKTLEQLQAMRRAGNPGAPAPKPLPEEPKPAAAAPPQPQPAPPQPVRPQPQPPSVASNLPAAPTPAPTRPNFATPSNAGQSVQDAANAAARSRGNSGEGGLNAPNRHAGAQSGVEVLSDMQGVDFGPYLKQLKRLITASWYPLIPEECYPPLNKEGETLIRFTILPNGNLQIGGMHLDGSTRDVAIDKAAWGGIVGVGQFPPLPKEFHGGNLQLRVSFVITHDRSQAE